MLRTRIPKVIKQTLTWRRWFYEQGHSYANAMAIILLENPVIVRDPTEMTSNQIAVL